MPASSPSSSRTDRSSPAWRINAGRRHGDESVALMVPAAVAVLGGSGIRWEGWSGGGGGKMTRMGTGGGEFKDRGAGIGGDDGVVAGGGDRGGQGLVLPEAVLADLAGQLVARARAGQPVALTGRGGLLSGLIGQGLRAGLTLELDDHLAMAGQEGNGRNGYRAKTLRTEAGAGKVAWARGRAGAVEPVAVPQGGGRGGRGRGTGGGLVVS